MALVTWFLWKALMFDIPFEMHQIRCFDWLATRLQPHTNQKNHTRTCCFLLIVRKNTSSHRTTKFHLDFGNWLCRNRFGSTQQILAGSGGEFCDKAAHLLPVVCFGGRTDLYWNPQVQVVFRVFTCFVHCSFQDEAVLSVIVAKAARIPAFDVVCWV